MNGILSDDEDTETGEEKLDKFELIKRGDIHKLLMQIPPDFNLAFINGVSYNEEFLIMKIKIASDRSVRPEKASQGNWQIEPRFFRHIHELTFTTCKL